MELHEVITSYRHRHFNCIEYQQLHAIPVQYMSHMTHDIDKMKPYVAMINAYSRSIHKIPTALTLKIGGGTCGSVTYLFCRGGGVE